MARIIHSQKKKTVKFDNANVVCLYHECVYLSFSVCECVNVQKGLPIVWIEKLWKFFTLNLYIVVLFIYLIFFLLCFELVLFSESAEGEFSTHSKISDIDKNIRWTSKTWKFAQRLLFFGSYCCCCSCKTTGETDCCLFVINTIKINWCVNFLCFSWFDQYIVEIKIKIRKRKKRNGHIYEKKNIYLLEEMVKEK